MVLNPPPRPRSFLRLFGRLSTMACLVGALGASQQLAAQAPPVWHTSDQKTASGSGTAVSVASPDNVSEGDLILLFFTQQRKPGTQLTGFSQPAGFRIAGHSHRAVTNDTNTDRPEVVVYYKIATASEPANYTSTATNHGSTPNWHAVAVRVTGHDQREPIGSLVNANSAATSVTTLSQPSLAITDTNSLLVAVNTVRVAATSPVTPAGMTSAVSIPGVGAADGNTNTPAFQAAFQTIASLGPSGARAHSWTTAGRAAGLMFEIKRARQLGMPRVNGLFYGDGDNNNYPSVPYATTAAGSRLYLQFIDGILSVALVVDRSINDSVFDNPFSTYMQSADWQNTNTSWHARVNSEFAEFFLTVGTGASEQSWNWQQGTAGIPDLGGRPETRHRNEFDGYISGTNVSGGLGIAPPNIVSASSLQWNINNYAQRVQTGTNTWTMPGANNNSGSWKSPWLGADNPPVFTSPVTANPNTVVNPAEGWPAIGQITYSPTYEWEWSMVYEWQLDLTQFGESPTFVVAGSSHHSPQKVGPEDDDPFDPPPPGGPDPLSDFGDLPSPYPTLLIDNGARHSIDPVGVQLGASLDSELNGQPHPQALGDDLSAVDDEDGIVFLTPFVAGATATVQVTIGNTGGFLSGFMDFNGGGTLTPINVTAVTGPATVATGILGDTAFPQPGVYTLTISVPSDATGVIPSRWRITNLSGQGGNSVTGAATSGEVEDHMLARVGDRVWNDLDNNGIQDVGEPGVSGVTVRLLDVNGDPVLDGAGNPVTATTDSSGNYSFIIPPGVQYRVEFDDLPPGFEFTLQNADSAGLTGEDNSDVDPITGQTALFSVSQGITATYLDAGIYSPPPEASVGDFVWEDLNGDGLQDLDEPGINGVTVELLDENGNVVATAVTADDSNGDPGYYLFTNVVPGTYSVRFVALSGFVFTVLDADNEGLTGEGNSDADPATGETVQFTVSVGDTIRYVDAGLFRQACPDTWVAWQGRWQDDLIGDTEPDANPDGDRYSNLIEYAFCMPPNSGVLKPFCLFESESVSDAVDGLFRRTAIGGAKDVTYVLEWTDVLGTPTNWSGNLTLTSSNTTVESNGDGTETVRISNLEDVTGLDQGTGFVRIRVDLDDGDTVASDATDVLGWCRTEMLQCCRTYNNPFLQCAAFTGTVSGLQEQEIDLSGSLNGEGSFDLSTLLTPGVAYYIEVETGALEGHRFDVQSADGSTITLAETNALCSLDGPFNTISGAIPASLIGERIALHRHWTLKDLFPPSEFGADTIQSDADEVQVYANNTWRIYWLYENAGDPIWVDSADAGNNDAGDSVIPPGQGMFYNNRNAARELLAFGEVRAHDFARPFCAGTNLVGGGYPVDQSASGRELTLSRGLFGSGDFAKADSFFIWRTDSSAVVTGFDSYWLLNAQTFQKWVLVRDAQLTPYDDVPLFLKDRAVFLRVEDANPGHDVPAPWSP